jgi:hypothetical protein
VTNSRVRFLDRRLEHDLSSENSSLGMRPNLCDSGPALRCRVALVGLALRDHVPNALKGGDESILTNRPTVASTKNRWTGGLAGKKKTKHAHAVYWYEGIMLLLLLPLAADTAPSSFVLGRGSHGIRWAKD